MHLLLDAPMLLFKGKYYFSDICYFYTFKSLESKYTNITIISRFRISILKPNNFELVDIDQLKIINDYNSPIKLIFSLYKIIKNLKNSIKKDDLVYSDSPLVVILLFFIQFNKRYVKFVYEIRNYVLLNLPYLRLRFGQFSGFLIKLLYSFVLKRIISSTDRLIVIDYPPKLNIFKNVANKMIILSDAYIDPKCFKIKSKFDHPRYFLFVGHLEKVKRIDWIIFSFSKLVQNGFDIYLSIVGDGPERNYLYNYVCSLGILDRVNFKGRIIDEIKLNNIYNNSDILLISSFTETGPRVLIEAIARDLQVFTSCNGYIPKLIDQRCVTNANNKHEYFNDLNNFLNKNKKEHIEIKTNNICIRKEFEKSILLNKRTQLWFDL